MGNHCSFHAANKSKWHFHVTSFCAQRFRQKKKDLPACYIDRSNQISLSSREGRSKPSIIKRSRIDDGVRIHTGAIPPALFSRLNLFHIHQQPLNSIKVIQQYEKWGTLLNVIKYRPYIDCHLAVEREVTSHYIMCAPAHSDVSSGRHANRCTCNVIQKHYSTLAAQYLRSQPIFIFVVDKKNPTRCHFLYSLFLF